VENDFDNIYYYLLPVMGAGKKRTVVTVTSIER